MKIKLSAKSIFIILIVLIITILGINYINRNSQLNSQKIQDIDPSKEGKTVGVNIEQNKPNGEKIKIIADQIDIIPQVSSSVTNLTPMQRIMSNCDHNTPKIKKTKNIAI